tara:strand:+ start:21807 stop:22517 length:711 start_codon:yes stop_codon:yes gene_type:complete
MKNIKAVLIILLAYFNSYAQDPQLFENIWYLQEVFIDDLQFSPPNIIGELETGSIHFFEEFDVININFCESIEALINYDSSENIFTLDDYPGVLLGDCLSPENNAFSIIYSSVFFNQSIAINPFTYSINNDNEIAVLTIVNPNGGVAVYGSELLSNQDFSLADFNIYPNPASNKITIESISQQFINKIQISDILGKLVLEQNNPSNEIDVSKLDSGLLLIKIETDQGMVIKKLIKN